MEGNLLLALHSIKEIIEDTLRLAISNYTSPEDPIVRFLEYGMGLDEMNTKRAHWLIAKYKGTPAAIAVLEEFATPTPPIANNLYYQQHIRFRNIEWYIDELYAPTSNVQTSSIATGSGQSVIYIPQKTATYGLVVNILYVTSKVTPDVFVKYFIDFVVHVIMVNKINILLSNYVLDIEEIVILINKITYYAQMRRYTEYRMINTFYNP